LHGLLKNIEAGGQDTITMMSERAETVITTTKNVEKASNVLRTMLERTNGASKSKATNVIGTG